MEYPLFGSFTSTRGICWNYKIYSDGAIEQWHSNIVRGEKATRKEETPL